MKNSKFLLLLALLNSAWLSAFCQPGTAEFNQVARDIGRWYDHLSSLALVIGAVCGLLGGLRVFNNWQLGRHHIDAQVAGWIGSRIFLSLLSAFIRALYNL